MLDFSLLETEEAPHVMPNRELETGMLDALNLDASPLNQLAIGWTVARGEFDGLRVDRPVRMATHGRSLCL
jgi:hypothetical protein